MSKKVAIKTVSIADIQKAGGADKYALTKGIDTRTKKLSGRISLSRKETARVLSELKHQG